MSDNAVYGTDRTTRVRCTRASGHERPPRGGSLRGSDHQGCVCVLATLKAYPNGGSMGRGNNAPVGGRRGSVTGWSRGSVRRHKAWLYSVDVAGLDGDGYGVTLTLRHTPASHDDWTALRLHRAFREAGLSRWHWVVEWQRRGTPHPHLAVYAPAGWVSPISDIMSGYKGMAAWISRSPTTPTRPALHSARCYHSPPIDVRRVHACSVSAFRNCSSSWWSWCALGCSSGHCFVGDCDLPTPVAPSAPRLREQRTTGGALRIALTEVSRHQDSDDSKRPDVGALASPPGPLRAPALAIR